MDIRELGRAIHENSKSKGFWDKERNIGEMLMLIVSEASEALEADRDSRFSDWSFDEPPIINADLLDDESFKVQFEKYVKNTMEDELADMVIRVIDLSYSRGMDLEWHIKQKMRYNSMREHRHGKKY